MKYNFHFSDIKLENVSVPGGVYSTLMQFGIIPEIFEAENDISTRWVGKDSWTYSKTFDSKFAYNFFKFKNFIVLVIYLN